MSSVHPVLLGGTWRASAGLETFTATNPRTTEPIPDRYPISPWAEVEAALQAAEQAFREMLEMPAEVRARFLERYADRIEARRAEIVAMAEAETALPAEPRLNSTELPRTTDQLRQAAAAAREGSWALPTIDRQRNIRSMYRPLGPVAVFGPNNFPLAFNSVAGGDFAAAVAAGCPVIAKANTSHPGTTRLLAEEAFQAVKEAGLPSAAVQLIYRTSHTDGERLVSHPLLGATAYTGSRAAGLVLKAAADRAGKPIYLELSSINPVVVLPGALRERLTKVADDFLGSCLLGTGQFCTNPGLVLLLAGPDTEAFIAEIARRFNAAPVGTLLSAGVLKSLRESIRRLQEAGAEVIAGGQPGGGAGFSHRNTLLKTTGRQFLAQPEAMQTEAFGNESLFVVCRDEDELAAVLEALEGQLTGCFYTDTQGSDDKLYARLEPILRRKVGRLLNDKMPTGVAVSPGMNHGGPYPATGHPGFTAVGIPASLRRFAMLACYDNVRPHRLPPELQDKNPNGRLWRFVDGEWTRS
ncbi:MAG: aldehyde dehydrogenase (NADP(+)) [Gemmatales bacterium]|nr:aldehyde dehydrogenase (NADP(+)) [Gemmatales bacterium]MDW8388472.1 aldehyde dehydrogenase (NADP(+)) [Gemmatales bacterium]